MCLTRYPFLNVNDPRWIILSEFLKRQLLKSLPKQLQLPYGFSSFVNGFYFNGHNFDVSLFSYPMKSITLMNFDLDTFCYLPGSLLSNLLNNPSFDSLVGFIKHIEFRVFFSFGINVHIDFTIFTNFKFFQFTLFGEFHILRFIFMKFDSKRKKMLLNHERF